MQVKKVNNVELLVPANAAMREQFKEHSAVFSEKSLEEVVQIRYKIILDIKKRVRTGEIPGFMSYWTLISEEVVFLACIYIIVTGGKHDVQADELKKAIEACAPLRGFSRFMTSYIWKSPELCRFFFKELGNQPMFKNLADKEKLEEWLVENMEALWPPCDHETNVNENNAMHIAAAIDSPETLSKLHRTGKNPNQKGHFSDPMISWIVILLRMACLDEALTWKELKFNDLTPLKLNVFHWLAALYVLYNGHEKQQTVQIFVKKITARIGAEKTKEMINFKGETPFTPKDIAPELF